MTLADKFKEGINFPSKTSLDNCEKIADEFAIGFARYMNERPNIFNNGNSMEQVLEIYKKEKGL
jgi:hypothetical protein